MTRKTVLNFFVLILTVVFSVSSLSTNAEALDSSQYLYGKLSDTVEWNYNKRSKVLTICGEGAAVSETQWQNSYPWSDFISGIKAVKFENGITEIGAFAFNGAKKLKTVTASNSVKKVGAYAFSGTKWLSSQKDGGVYIGRVLYAWKGDIPGGSPTFKKNTYSISDYAFANNTSLTSLTIPAKIKRIGNNAFIWCTNLSSVTFKKGVTTLGESAFSNCTSLKSVTLPSSLKKIPSFAFGECKNLTSVTIPSKVTSVSDFAFYNCTSLNSVKFSAKLKTISAETFYGCKKLKKITVPEDNKHFSTDKKSILYNKNKTKLYFMPAGNKITSYTVNSKTTTIASSAFTDNTTLQTLKLPKKLTTIGEAAFSGCTNLASISVPSGVKKMNNTAITDTLWYKNQDGLIYFGKVLLGHKGFMADNTWLKIKEGTVSIADYALSDKPELSSITFPDTLENIGNHAFALCTGLKNIVIPASVKSIGQGAFRDCTGFGKITVLNPFCKIDTSFNLVFPGNAQVNCYRYSTAEETASVSNCTVSYLENIDIKDLDMTILTSKKSDKPVLTISFYGTKLKAGVHYDITYQYNKTPHTATVIARENTSCFSGKFVVNLTTGQVTSTEN